MTRPGGLRHRILVAESWWHRQAWQRFVHSAAIEHNVVCSTAYPISLLPVFARIPAVLSGRYGCWSNGMLPGGRRPVSTFSESE